MGDAKERFFAHDELPAGIGCLFKDFRKNRGEKFVQEQDAEIVENAREERLLDVDRPQLPGKALGEDAAHQ